MGDLLGVILTLCGSLIFARRRSFRYLSALQQDEYSAERLLLWFIKRRAFDTKGSLLSLFLVALSLIPQLMGILNFPPLILGALACLGAVILATKEMDPRHEGKVRLVMTERAYRIYLLHAVLSVLLLALLALIPFVLSLSPTTPYCIALQVIFYQALPFCLALAVKILQPMELSMQRHYLAEAKRRIADCSPFIIGITGSYGKTSTKNALGDILQVALGSTFWPKKGVNTLMGNTREIRERLNSSFQYAIIEMAAYRRGSIAKLCELAPPRAGIITAIGMMHLERFGSLDEIYRAKTELARAIPDDGILVCNGDDPGARKAASEFRKKTTLLYGFEESFGTPDCIMSEVKTTPSGSQFTIHWKGERYHGSTGLLGKPALSNLMGVFTLACALGGNPKLILAALYNLKPVENRLSLEKSDKVLRLKDAYNSNPVGFAAALEVLADMPAKNRNLMTPGMIELGERQEAENEAIARKVATICNNVIVVGDTNRAAFESGLKEGGFAMANAHFIGHRNEALVKLAELEGEGDVSLIENDLSDWYEDVSRY